MTRKNPGSILMLPEVDRMEGLSYETTAGPDVATVELQWRNAHTGTCAVRMHLRDALYLANLLDQMIADQGLQHLIRPAPPPPA